MQTIRHIVFDIGRVLIHYDPDTAFRAIIPDDERRGFFFANVCTGAWNVEQDRGRTWPDAEAEAIARHPDWADEIRAFRANWPKMVPHAYDNTVAVLMALIKGGWDTTFLTNFASDTFTQAQEMYPFLKAGRGVTVSGRVGLIKPDPAIYAKHIEAFDLDPAATFFVDDSPPNVTAAREAGWNAELYEGADKLKADLGRYGITLEGSKAL